MRPSWDDTWLAAAQVVGRRSLCTRASVGCVVVDNDNRVVASGYNGPPAGFRHADTPCLEWCTRARQADLGVVPRKGYDTCPSLHAEANALLVGDRRDRAGGTLYVTAHVCLDCAKLVANSGLSRVVVGEPVAAPWRVPEDSYSYLRALGLTVEVR